MKKMLIVGASGLLGSRLMLRASGRFDVVGTCNPAVDGKDCPSLLSLDISSKDEVCRLLEKIRPDCVILTAAVSDLEVCERNPELAQRINADGPEYVANCCKRLDAKLLHLSSVYVFDGGKKGRYVEDDPPNPLSVYAKTKIAGERAISSILADFIIVRSAVMYGWPPSDVRDNFVTMTINRLRAKQPMRLYDDQRTSPTFCDDIARSLLDLSETDHNGILNLSGPDCISRFGCGMVVADIFDLDGSLISPVSLASMSLAARRPMHACLDVSKAERILKRGMVAFEDGIRTMKKQEESQDK